MGDRPGIGNPQDRELQYYRSECNDLGGRLLRLQEEQSQAFLEARRSRTVVRLVREAYLLAEPSQAMHDVGGAVLQVIVENALCDRAALLREEPLGSSRFLVAHAIGGTSVEADQAVMVSDPPNFFFTSSLRFDRPPPGLLDVLHLPFVLWAYDKSSGHALVMGNRSEGNVTRAFVSGDQELIEAALTVYLDVMYRKYAEVQLRQAKQTAEEVTRSQARFLKALSQQVKAPAESIATLVTAMVSQLEGASGMEDFRTTAQQLAACSHELLRLANDAGRLATPIEQFALPDVQWIDLGEVVRRVFRSSYPISVKSDVELDVSLPRRNVSICADRESMHRAIQTIVSDSLARALPRSAVKLSATRRGDGAVEILVSCATEIAPAHVVDSIASSDPVQMSHSPHELGSERLSAARRIVEAHDGVLVTEARRSGGTQARIILPPHIAREYDEPV